MSYGLSSIFSNLSLTSTQQSQLQSILQNTQNQGTSRSQVATQIESVLSPAQQATFQSDLTKMRSGGHSGQHHHGGGGSTANSETDNVLSPSCDPSQATSGQTATVNGLTVSDLQNQLLAGNAISQLQLQNEILQTQ